MSQSLFIKHNKFLFKMYLISLKYHHNPSIIFSVYFSSAEVIVRVFFPASFLYRQPCKRDDAQELQRYSSHFANASVSSSKSFSWHVFLTPFYGFFNLNLLIVEMISCSYCCTVSLKPHMCQKTQNRRYEAGSEKTANILFCLFVRLLTLIWIYNICFLGLRYFPRWLYCSCEYRRG